MNSPPKAKRGLCGTALRITKLRLQYHLVAALAKLFEIPFWLFEQPRGRLQDRIDNEGSGR
jgi:hypothetical protein